jgi:hypothetical protein
MEDEKWKMENGRSKNVGTITLWLLCVYSLRWSDPRFGERSVYWSVAHDTCLQKGFGVV